MTNLCMPFPLRPRYTAQVVIPHDMSKAEADRLCAFVQSLAQPDPLDEVTPIPEE